MRFLIKDAFSKEKEEVIVGFENGVAKLDSKEFIVTIKINIAEFSSLFLGCVSIRGLFNLGLLELDNEEFIDELDRAFYCSEKPVCYTDF